MEGRTVVLIAHRLSTVVNADQILVLIDGSIAQQGTHASLVLEDGPYQRMWDDYCSSVAWELNGSGAKKPGASAIDRKEAGDGRV
jgi:ATP-binding cassette subfamily B protein